MILIDSNIWIEASREKGDIITKLSLEGILKNDKALLCGPVALEVLGGARKQERKRFKEFFHALPYHRTGHALWQDAIALSWQIRDKGLTLPWNDILIASIAMDTGGWIFSHDKHFEFLSSFLPIHLYKPGYNGQFNPSYS